MLRCINNEDKFHPNELFNIMAGLYMKKKLNIAKIRGNMYEELGRHNLFKNITTKTCMQVPQGE